MSYFYKSSKSDPVLLAAAGVGLAAAGVGLALWKRGRSADSRSSPSDAPNWTKANSSDRALFGKSLLVNRPRDELFAAWKVDRFPEFMENVVTVEELGDDISKWTVKGPAGHEVTLVNQVTETVEGEAIYWQSTSASDVANSGEVKFVDAPGGRGTYVSLILAYDPPGGKLGRLAAKLLQREPEVQARRDLHRFKQLMETGEVTSNASPSARSSERPTEPHI
jgi:uncharacterized membrane protein